MINLAKETTPILFDLVIGLIKNETGIPFIIGQHPSTIVNPFLCEKNWIGSKQGFANNGTLIFLPLSPEYLLVVYDNVRYSFANYNKIGSLNIDDVNKINQLQFSYTTDCIICTKNISLLNLNDYNNITSEFRNNDKVKIHVFKGQNTKKEKTELIWTSSIEPPITQSFSFINIKSKAFLENLGKQWTYPVMKLDPY